MLKHTNTHKHICIDCSSICVPSALCKYVRRCAWLALLQLCIKSNILNVDVSVCVSVCMNVASCRNHYAKQAAKRSHGKKVAAQMVYIQYAIQKRPWNHWNGRKYEYKWCCCCWACAICYPMRAYYQNHRQHYRLASLKKTQPLPSHAMQCQQKRGRTEERMLDVQRDQKWDGHWHAQHI